LRLRGEEKILASLPERTAKIEAEILLQKVSLPELKDLSGRVGNIEAELMRQIDRISTIVNGQGDRESLHRILEEKLNQIQNTLNAHAAEAARTRDGVLVKILRRVRNALGYPWSASKVS